MCKLQLKKFYRIFPRLKRLDKDKALADFASDEEKCFITFTSISS
jgi:hypothetical protein